MSAYLSQMEESENSRMQSFERMKAHLKEISDILKEEEGECQSQLMTTPHGYYMEEEGICYHEEESSPIYWPQQYQEEEWQSQLVANPNGHYMEDDGTYYHEQAVTLSSEEVVENQVDERKEEQTAVPQKPYKEK
jgi:hypothetical protein